MHYTEWDEIDNESSNRQNNVETFNDVEVLEPSDVRPVHYDLSGDTMVNDYISDQHQSQGLVMVDPDAELINVNKPNPKFNEYYRYESQPSQQNDDMLEKL